MELPVGFQKLPTTGNSLMLDQSDIVLMPLKVRQQFFGAWKPKTFPNNSERMGAHTTYLSCKEVKEEIRNKRIENSSTTIPFKSNMTVIKEVRLTHSDVHMRKLAWIRYSYSSGKT